MKPIGWRYESHRHALAARGIRTTYFAKRKGLPGEELVRRAASEARDERLLELGRQARKEGLRSAEPDLCPTCHQPQIGVHYHKKSEFDKADSGLELSKVWLEDDGTMDTVVSVKGKEIRYDPEFASQFRDKKGIITEKGWEKLKEQALKDYEDQYMANKGYYALTDTLDWFRDLGNEKRVTEAYTKDSEQFGREQDAFVAYASPTDVFMQSAFFAKKKPWEELR
jgi:hypothetical protein